MEGVIEMLGPWETMPWDVVDVLTIEVVWMVVICCCNIDGKMGGFDRVL